MKKPRLEHFSVPHLVHIEMSYACNAKCFFCYNPYRDSPIDYKKIDKVVRAVSKSHIPHVYLIGGEPSLLESSKLNEYIDLLSKTSSVTIVTNGLKYVEGMSKNLACLGVAIHGNAETQEWLSGVKGGYSRTVENIKKYVRDGFDVRCIPVLTSKNYDQIYNIIKLAKELGMESVFVDKFEIGGMGLDMANQLKPSLEQFKVSLGQMIKARDEFNIPVGFGTAIPYCLDERLIKEEMFANCGVGVTFAAVNPNGDFRICNQSEIVYGNVLKEPIEEIWKKKSLEDFRNLSWTQSPCDNCILVTECTGGCKVDLSCSSGYCIDYHIRENQKELVSVKEVEKLWKEREERITQKFSKVSYPKEYREFFVDKHINIIKKHKENYLITRYQTIIIDNLTTEIIEKIMSGIKREKDLIKAFNDRIEEEEIREFLSKLEIAEAIFSVKIKSLDWEITGNCNLDCKHCIVSSPHATESITVEQIIRAINKLYDNGLREISFTGGEPMLFPGIIDILKYNKEKGIKSRILTNGTLLSKDIVKEISEFVSEIGVSLDGITEDANDSIRGKGSYKRIMKGINNLKEIGIDYSIYFTLHKKNKDIKKMIQFSKELGASSCRINQITKRGRAEDKYEENFLIDTKNLVNTLDESKCDLDSSHIFVNPSGDCFPCVEISQIKGKSLGNIFSTEVVDIYKNLNEFIVRNKEKDCPYCMVIEEFETICLDKDLTCKSA